MKSVKMRLAAVEYLYTEIQKKNPTTAASSSSASSSRRRHRHRQPQQLRYHRIETVFLVNWRPDFESPSTIYPAYASRLVRGGHSRTHVAKARALRPAPVSRFPTLRYRVHTRLHAHHPRPRERPWATTTRRFPTLTAPDETRLMRWGA